MGFTLFPDFVTNQANTAALALKANAANPVFTGTVTFPTSMTGHLRAAAGVITPYVLTKTVSTLTASVNITTDFGGPGGNTYQTTGLSVTVVLPYAQTVKMTALISGSSANTNCNPIVGYRVDGGTTVYGTHASLGTAAGSASRLNLFFGDDIALSAGSHTIEIMAAKGTGTQWTIEGTQSQGASGIGTGCNLTVTAWL